DSQPAAPGPPGDTRAVPATAKARRRVSESPGIMKRKRVMLSEQVIELLTGYVDGELSQRQRRAVMRLLHKSSEAREMLRQLQENAHQLKQLPFHKVQPSLVDEVMRAIAEQQAQPRPAAPPRGARRRWLPYLAATLAASLLIGAIGI